MSDWSDNSAVARWFSADGRVLAARVSFENGEVRARNDECETRAVPMSAVSVSPRLGNIPRRIEFPDGVSLAVDDNDFVDAALRRRGQMRGARALHVFESRPAWIVALLLAALLVAWLAATRGIPLAGKIVAFSVSHETLRALSDEAREAMTDEGILSASELPEDARTRAQELFARLTARFAEDDADYRLLFYRMRFHGRETANAFALPDGTIALTDRLMTLADDDELTAVLAHEIGHARERHGARMLAQAAGAAGLAALIFGDITGVLGAAMLSAGYSRGFEREADCFAYGVLNDLGVDWRKLGDALQKMEKDAKPKPPAISSGEGWEDGWEAEETDGANAMEQTKQSNLDAAVEAGLEKFADFLSTHPPSAARSNPGAHCG